MSAIGKTLRSFVAFWWDFIVGDDVTIAIGVVVGLGAIAALHSAKVTSWWALPVLWGVALYWSLKRAIH
jgi:hypothetical protein